MKKIISILKKQSKLVIGIFIGTILTTCIGYGVNQIQSSSVSYTRDGKTMSVEEAIDDLIVKVNKKNLDIELDPGNKLRLKSTIENPTYESSNEDVANVDERGLVTAKTPGTAKITVKNDSISSSVNVTVDDYYLADVANVGDYVAYDAGSWTSTAAKPTSQGQFGGYTSGQNKANSVACYYSTTLKGWRVLSIDTSTKTVTLIHAGHSECYYHGGSNNSNASITNLNNRATSTYLNSNYADSVHMMNIDDALTITGSETTNNNLRANGSTCWLSTAYNGSDLLVVHGDNGSTGGRNSYPFGVRPVIVLKSKIRTGGKGTDMVGQVAWTLVKP